MMWSKGNPFALLMGMQIGVTTENSMEVPPKFFKNSSFTSGYLFEENQNTNLKRYMYPHVHCSIIYDSQARKAT